MSRSKYLGLLALFLTGLFTSRARANEPDRPQPYVVIVGIDRYQDPQILPRKHAEADARALYDVFTHKDYLGVDGKHVRLLLGSPDARRNAETANRANILKALTWAGQSARRLRPGDRGPVHAGRAPQRARLLLRHRLHLQEPGEGRRR